jgi:hypothetical protein
MTEKDPCPPPGEIREPCWKRHVITRVRTRTRDRKTKSHDLLFRYQLTYVCIITALSVEVGLSDMARSICRNSRTLASSCKRRYGALCCLPETPGDRKGLQHFSTSLTKCGQASGAQRNCNARVLNALKCDETLKMNVRAKPKGQAGQV